MKKRILSVLLVVALLAVGCVFAVQATEPESEPAKNFVADNAKNEVYAASLEMDFSDPNNLPTTCPYCGKDATWKALPGSGANRVISGHYYAASDIDMGSNYYVVAVSYNTTTEKYSTPSLCVHLNGKTIQANGIVFDVRTYSVKTNPVEYAEDGTTPLYNYAPDKKATLNVMGSGTVIGGGTAANAGVPAGATSEKNVYSANNGASTIYANGNVNLCGGTWKHKSNKNNLPTMSVNNQARVNIYEGTVFTADEGVKGRNIVVESGTLWMYGGIVEKGDVTGLTGVNRFGGNILFKGSGKYSDATYSQTMQILGGTIRDGKAHSGGNIAIFTLFGNDNFNLRFVNCLIDNGQAVKTDAGDDGNGGNVFIQYSMNPSTIVRFNNATDLTVSNGKAEGVGGNVYFYQNLATTSVTTCHMIVQGGDFLDGQATAGGNFYITGAKGNFYIGGDAQVLRGQAKLVRDAETNKVTALGNGGNLYLASGTMNINDLVFNEGKEDQYYEAPTLDAGHADSHGGNVYVAGGTLTFRGGTISAGVSEGATLNSLPDATLTPTAGNVYIDAGEFKMVDDEAKTGHKTVITGGVGQNGGNVYLAGINAVLNMQGGVIEKGYATSRGNNIYLRAGEVQLLGGTINNNTTEEETDSYDGNSLYIGAIASTKKAQLTLGGNVTLNTPDATSNIYMNNQATGLLVKENFTGDVRISIAGPGTSSPTIRPTSGYYGYHIGSEYVKEAATAPVWGAEGAYTGKLTMVVGDSNPAVFPVANGAADGITHDLVVASVRGTTYVGEGEEQEKVQTWYADAEDAIAGGDDYFALFAPADFEIPAGKTAYVNINGKDVTVSGEGKLLLIDYSENKGKVTVTGNVQLENNSEDGKLVMHPEGTSTYLTYKNTDGTYSSYKLRNLLKGVSLRPSTAGIYFRGAWDTQLLPANVKNYGSVVSRVSQPTDNFVNDPNMAYTAYTELDGEQKTGVEITGIFKEGEDNATRGQAPIYAASYIVVNNGVEDVTILATVEDQYSMYSVLNMMEDSDTVWAAYADALNAFYSNWSADLTSWNFDRLGK